MPFELQLDPTTGIPLMPVIPAVVPAEITPTEAEQTALELRWNRSPYGDKLRELEITPDKQLPKREFLFRMLGKPCFPRGELVAVTGKAKSGKTYLCSALIVAHQTGRCLGITRQTEPQPGYFPQRVLWIDTEQSEESTQEILTERIMPLTAGSTAPANLQVSSEPALMQAGSEPAPMQVSVINMRSISWQDRMNLIEAAIEITHAALVIFDGIRDVVDDINKIAEAHEVVENLMQIASKNNSCIVCVLHQNKSLEDHSLRGALGTELQNKAFECYECVKEENKTIEISQSFTRKYDIVGKLRFAVGDDGLPQLLYAPAAPEAPAATSALPALQQPVSTMPARPLPDLLKAAFGADTELRAGALKWRIRQQGCSDDDYFRIRADAVRMQLLTRREVSGSEVYYSLSRPHTDKAERGELDAAVQDPAPEASCAPSDVLLFSEETAT